MPTTHATAAAADAPSGAMLLNDAMRASLEPVAYAAGETVIRQGEAGERFFVIDTGALDIIVTSEQGVRLPVARLGPGSHFGEMSLLAGTAVSADVVASEPSVLYAANPEEFRRIIHGDPRIIEHLAGTLANRLKLANEQLVVQQQRQATLSKLISNRPASRFLTDLPSFGKNTTAAIAEACRHDLPLLITGENGVGKRALGLHIHAAHRRSSQAVLVVDCRELPPEHAHEQLFGDADPGGITRFASRLGYLQAADRGTLVLACADRLPAAVQRELAVFLQSQSAGAEVWRVDVRVICTGEASGLDETLQRAFADRVIALPPLRQRRRDIEPLARHLLAASAQRAGTAPKQLGESASRALLAYDFRIENVEELGQVLHLASDLADGEVIEAEHLFFGSGRGADPLQVDLLRWKWLEGALQRGRLMAGLKVLVALAFAAIVAACLVLPAALPGRVANLLVWGVWWPALVVSMVLFGRLWCAVCPISSGAEACKHAGGRDLPPPPRLRQAGVAVALTGFIAIFWIEQMTGMADHPRYTAALLIGLAVIAAVIGWFFQRHTWCRYLCPLGAMGAVFSVLAMLRVQARQEVCQGSCNGNQCYKGSDRVGGCPMFNHALFLNGGQQCKLCMQCLQACPSLSPRLIVQPPLQDIWHSNLLSTEMVPMAAIIAFLTLLLAATPATGLAMAAEKRWFIIGVFLVLAAGLALYLRLTAQQGREDGRRAVRGARVLYAYMPAVAGLLFAFHIRALPWLREGAVHFSTPRGDLGGASLLQLTQGSVLAIGGLLTCWALWKLSAGRAEHRAVPAVVAWAPLAALAAGYLFAGALLLR